MALSKYHAGYFPIGKQNNKWTETNNIEHVPTKYGLDICDSDQRLFIPTILDEPEHHKVLLDAEFNKNEVFFTTVSEKADEFLWNLTN